MSVPSPRSPVTTAVSAVLLEPAEQAAQLGAQYGFVFEAGEQRLDAVEEHALGADGIDGVAEPDEQAFEVVLAGLLDLAAFEVDVIDQQLLPGDEGGQVEAERSDIGGEFVGGFLEGETDAGLVELHGAADEEFHAKQRLAAAGGAADERGPSARQAADGDLVEAVDAGGTFGKSARAVVRYRRVSFPGTHAVSPFSSRYEGRPHKTAHARRPANPPSSKRLIPQGYTRGFARSLAHVR